jgi:uncharacterized protein (DUF169 family)
MDYKKCADTIMRRVMPQSFPLGVKIVKKDDPVPEGIVRPGKFKIKIAMCQWTTTARRWGWTVGSMGEDINCSPCLAGFGFMQLREKSDLADFFMEMGYFESRDLAMKLVENFQPLTPGEVNGVVSFPLENAPLDPDLVIIYGTPAQMARLAAGFIHHHGYLIKSQTGFGLSCLAGVMPYWTQEPTFVHPGRGERILAGTDDSEMFFSMPAQYLESLADGLEKTHKKGTRYPVQSYLLYQPPVIPPMQALQEKLIKLKTEDV